MSTPMTSPGNHGTTIKQFTKELMNDWEPEDWFLWPPDVFALTSMLLKSTGLYRYTVSPHPLSKERLRCAWESKGDEAKTALAWYRWLLGFPGSEFPEALRRSKEALFDDENRLGLYDFKISQDACASIMHLHAVADTACGGFGLPSAPGGSMNEVLFLANALLGLTGTLSRLPKRHGIVLPKMRAPQSGLTLRSFSHNLSFHRSEVNVRWGTIPWINQDYNTVNVIAVPEPYAVDSQSFRPCVDYPGQEQDIRGFDYFEYAADSTLDVGRVVSLINRAHREVSRVHVLVFPEVALTWRDLNSLKSALESEIKAPHQIPLIVAGLRGGEDGSEKRNQVVLSAFFANKWYDLKQDKHHRWKLDEGQIRQYSLAGSLNVKNQWWEGIDVYRRHLTFLAPNGWLTLCPLICEDLAQLEPVSDLIRGVGPTLVIAILMDGPQLTHRWSARYVGVLVDDPGTSALTLTSLGMALRAKAKDKPEDRTVALWRDRENGWEPLKLEPGSEALLITISAKWYEEFTADGRGDNNTASTFILRGAQNLQADRADMESVRERLAARPQDDPDSSKSTDVLELSVFSYLVDAFVDAPSDLIGKLRAWASDPSSVSRGASLDRGRLKTFDSLWERLMAAVLIHSKGSAQWPPPGFKYAVERAADLTAPENEGLDVVAERKDEAMRLGRWERLVARAEADLARERGPEPAGAGEGRPGLDPSQVKRLNRLASLSVLWAVHNRASKMKYDQHAGRGADWAGRETDPSVRPRVDRLLRRTEESQKELVEFQEHGRDGRSATAGREGAVG